MVNNSTQRRHEKWFISSLRAPGFDKHVKQQENRLEVGATTKILVEVVKRRTVDNISWKKTTPLTAPQPSKMTRSILFSFFICLRMTIFIVIFYFPITVSGTIRPPHFWQGRSSLHWQNYVFQVNDRNMRLQIQEFSCAKETKDLPRRVKQRVNLGVPKK